MAGDALPAQGLGGGGGFMHGQQSNRNGGGNIFKKACVAVVDVYNKLTSNHAPGLHKHF